MRVSWIHGGSAAAVAIGAVAACSSDEPIELGFDRPDAGSDAAAEAANFGDGSGACDRVCASDQRSVVDCNGDAVDVCSPEEACLGGACVSACEASVATRSAIGCDYFPHPPFQRDDEYCYAVHVVNAWTTPATLSAEAQGTSLDVSQFAYLPEGSGDDITYRAISGSIPPGKIAILFLRGPCPARSASFAAWTDPIAGTGGRGRALHLTTSVPVIAYDIMPFGGASSHVPSASLLLPVSTWDTGYVAVTPYPYGPNTSVPTFSVIASEDDTQVTLLPTEEVTEGGGLPAMSPNVPYTFNLARGQVLRVAQKKDLVGSILGATKPIGLWADQDCINIDEMACDSAHQQIPSINALGSEYVGARYHDRVAGTPESPPWRMIGLVEGTTLTWEPEIPEGAPTTLQPGETITFRAGEDFVVRSQDGDHPFYMNGYMTGASPFGDIGDPEFVNLVPPSQFLDRYVFFTDPTYKQTELVLVRAKHDGAFSDVWLDCAGALAGWTPVGTSGRYEATRFDFGEACENGVHEAKSDAPFGLTVWGLDWYSSYAYPGGMHVRKINDVVVPPVPR